LKTHFGLRTAAIARREATKMAGVAWRMTDGPVPADLPPVTSPQLYQLQFSTAEEHVNLIERAKALMARERPGVSASSTWKR
jgi:hypothetical protein